MSKLSYNEKRFIFKRDKYRCQYCNIKCFDPDLIKDNPHARNKNGMATVDHIKSRANGGNNLKDNLVTACWRCNNEKGHKEQLIIY